MTKKKDRQEVLRRQQLKARVDTYSARISILESDQYSLRVTKNDHADAILQLRDQVAALEGTVGFLKREKDTADRRCALRDAVLRGDRSVFTSQKGTVCTLTRNMFGFLVLRDAKDGEMFEATITRRSMLEYMQERNFKPQP